MTVLDRSEYATARDADVAVLREAFDEGRAFTKDTAAEQLGIPERRLRAAVSELRRLGYPVYSTSQQGSRYRRCRNQAELEELIAREIHPRAVDLLTQEHEMRDHAGEFFGEPVQSGLWRDEE